MLTTVQYLLTVLMEEAAEVQHRASKAIRFGLMECQSGQLLNNQARLSAEVDDLLGTIKQLRDLGVLPNVGGTAAMQVRIDRCAEYMDYSRKIGILEPK